MELKPHLTLRLSVAFSLCLSVCAAPVFAQDQQPLAYAGPDQFVYTGATVTLNGALWDYDGDPFTYLWEQTAGDPVTLSDPTGTSSDPYSTVTMPTFIAPGTAQDLWFKLTVTQTTCDVTYSCYDPTGLPDTVKITVLSSVPLPAAAWLFGSGLAALAGYARCRARLA